MGFTPAQVDAMSCWEWAACCDGFDRAHGGKPKGSGDIDDARMREMGIAGF